MMQKVGVCSFSFWDLRGLLLYLGVKRGRCSKEWRGREG